MSKVAHSLSADHVVRPLSCHKLVEVVYVERLSAVVNEGPDAILLSLAFIVVVMVVMMMMVLMFIVFVIMVVVMLMLIVVVIIVIFMVMVFMMMLCLVLFLLSHWAFQFLHPSR